MNLENMHFLGLYFIIILQCTVKNIEIKKVCIFKRTVFAACDSHSSHIFKSYTNGQPSVNNDKNINCTNTCIYDFHVENLRPKFSTCSCKYFFYMFFLACLIWLPVWPIYVVALISVCKD